MYTVTYNNKKVTVYKLHSVVMSIPLKGRDPIKLRETVLQLLKTGTVLGLVK